MECKVPQLLTITLVRSKAAVNHSTTQSSLNFLQYDSCSRIFVEALWHIWLLSLSALPLSLLPNSDHFYIFFLSHSVVSLFTPMLHVMIETESPSTSKSIQMQYLSSQKYECLFIQLADDWWKAQRYEIKMAFATSNYDSVIIYVHRLTHPSFVNININQIEMHSFEISQSHTKVPFNLNHWHTISSTTQ